MSDDKTPAVRISGTGLAPVDGCRICYAAVQGRAAAWKRGDNRGVQNYNEMIWQHPHQRATDRRGTT
ncbi:hypothetical protein ACH4GP_23145 [Streptomyces celluloflavus]|uniref:Uncharacterized protein n=1 Tax=Streptomyces celluloflavus TaxID=58344 RepID=A0ABW7RK00_9ACTN